MRTALGIVMAWCRLLGPAGGRADEGLKDPAFEEGDVGAAPAGWTLTTTGVTAALTDDDPRRGEHGVRVGSGDRPGDAPRCLVWLQPVAAAPDRGKLIRLKAAVRIDAAGPLDRAPLRLRGDRPDRRTGFFDDRDDRPIRGKAWGRLRDRGGCRQGRREDLPGVHRLRRRAGRDRRRLAPG
jgi:hypothetical protein